MRTPLAIAIAAVAVSGCGGVDRVQDVIFLDGRGVAAVGDSLLAFTRRETPGVVLRPRTGGPTYAAGGDFLQSPRHVQEHRGDWYVSDVSGGRPAIVVLGPDFALRRRMELDSLGATPHQFAVLPDGRVVIETADGQLVAQTGDAIETFALTERSQRPGFLLGALGGVLHAVHGKTITLYNELGNIRWRLAWPWNERAFVTDLAVDAQGRMHILAGEEGTDRFVVFSLAQVTGEIIRWSEPGPVATFVVDRLGTITPGESAEIAP